MPKFAANLSFLFQDLDFLDRFEAAKQAGFQAVEYLFPYDYPASDIAERLETLGLTQALFNLSPGDWDAGERGLAALPGRESEFRESVELAAQYAEALGCAQVHVMAGIVPDGAERERYEACYVENLNHAAEMLGASGIRALIEPLNTTDMPGYLLTGSEQARRIIQAVGSPNLFLQYDIYHMQIMEGHLAESIARDQDIIRHIQIAGVPGRHEPDVGEINYPFIFNYLDEIGYDGWVGCEYRPQASTLEGLAWAAPYGIAAPS